MIIDWKENDHNHLDFLKMALLLCKIIPGTIWDIHLQHAIILYFLLAYSNIYFFFCFLMQVIEITRTLTLLFTLLHCKTSATMRLKGFTLLYSACWASSGVVKWAKKDVKPKLAVPVVSILVNLSKIARDMLARINWLNKTIIDKFCLIFYQCNL